MADMLPVLQPLQITTSLLLARSITIFFHGLSNNVEAGQHRTPVDADDSQPVVEFKKFILLVIRDQFHIESAEVYKHPFVVSTVLDPSLMGLDARGQAESI